MLEGLVDLCPHSLKNGKFTWVIHSQRRCEKSISKFYRGDYFEKGNQDISEILGISKTDFGKSSTRKSKVTGSKRVR